MEGRHGDEPLEGRHKTNICFPENYSCWSWSSSEFQVLSCTCMHDLFKKYVHAWKTNGVPVCRSGRATNFPGRRRVVRRLEDRGKNELRMHCSRREVTSDRRREASSRLVVFWSHRSTYVRVKRPGDCQRLEPSDSRFQCAVVAPLPLYHTTPPLPALTSLAACSRANRPAASSRVVRVRFARAPHGAVSRESPPRFHHPRTQHSPSPRCPRPPYRRPTRCRSLVRTFARLASGRFSPASLSA